MKWRPSQAGREEDKICRSWMYHVSLFQRVCVCVLDGLLDTLRRKRRPLMGLVVAARSHGQRAHVRGGEQWGASTTSRHRLHLRHKCRAAGLPHGPRD